MAIRVEGQAIAERILQDVRSRAAAFTERSGRPPQLAIVRYGAIKDAVLYARTLRRACQRTGLAAREQELSASLTIHEALAAIQLLNDDPAVDGILIQTPLPGHLPREQILARVNPLKDVDGLTPENQGLLLLGQPRHVPATAEAIVLLAEQAAHSLRGLRVTVIGRSNVVGLPAALLFLRANATVTICHRSTKELEVALHSADVVVAAAGTPGLISGDMIRPGAIVIDAGTTMTAEGLRGDVDFTSTDPVAGYLTPVPGGVGRVTNALLLRGVVTAAEENRSALPTRRHD
ncbi:MAG: bifunctional 5,10-methylenetetrahydrofolate dehydrogenase/5,10-methenyltetrahydrofolate cyclohydrolase [Chloroflexi bacterium]|nr:bifunctional 5,10-methylenetetrahydrofolate dehydrogenase/5,10-methenyltetrahydrofolate cyclohydrolase [Chloroflexota bacterium]